MCDSCEIAREGCVMRKSFIPIRTRLSTRRIAVAFCGTALLAAGLAVGVSTPVALAGARGDAAQATALADVEQAIAAIGEAHASEYGGMKLVDNYTHIVVYLTDLGASVEKSFQAAAGAAGILSFQ